MKFNYWLTVLFGCSLLNAKAQAFNFPWSDSAKYRRECTKACIEESFGKAKAFEINQRCSSKCDHLPLSPKEVWEAYDHCMSAQKQYIDFYKKNIAQLDSCEAEKAQKLTICKKSYGSSPDSQRSGGYIPGQVYKDHLREQALEKCQLDVSESVSKQCHQLTIARISIGGPIECAEPKIPRPR